MLEFYQKGGEKMNLKNTCFNIWKTNFDRKGINPQFKPIFTRYIGVENINEYNDILKTFVEKINNCPYAVCFDGNIPMQAEFDIINYVGRELQTMDVTNLKTQDIVLFQDTQWNTMFLESLDYIVNLAIKQENFFNDSVRNDFILKLIVWTYSYIRPMIFESNICPKCFYYGDISRHEIYFLMMLHMMTFDVIFVNPLRDENWEEVDTIKLSSVHKNSQILQIESLSNRIKNAKNIEYEESITLQLEREIENELLTNTGVYRSWQFRDGNTKSLFIKSTIIDLMNNYAEPSRVRNGFKVEGKTVTIPNYFFQIDGENYDFEEYSKLINTCIETPNTLVLTDAGKSLIESKLSEEQKLKLTFCLLSDGSFNIEEIKKLDFYLWDKYRDALEDFLLNKINELLKDNLYKKNLSQKEQFDLVADILSINQSIIKMADNFDYTDKVPKLVIFLNNEDFIDDEILYLIGFVNELGFDIIIFSPAGLISIDSVFNTSRFNSIRLDNMVYDDTLENIKRKSKSPKGFFSKLFG